MTLSVNSLLSEQVKFVSALSPIVPSTSTPRYVSLKGFPRCCIIITATNGGAGVVGSAITVKQATTIAGAGEKAVPFARVHQNIDVGAAGGDALAETAVTSNTFTTDATISKNQMYIVEISEADLDIDGGFDCIRAGTGNGTATTVSVVYALYPSKYNARSTSSILD